MSTSYVRLEHSTPDHKDWFVVNWCLSNVCNFSCSYCPVGLHDGSIGWPDPEIVKEFITRICQQRPDKKVYFEFTGGEVTVFRQFTEICKHIHDLGAKVGLISNGSRSVAYWEKNKQYFDHVCLSYHPEFAREEHFLKVVKTINNDVRTHVNIMMKPEIFDQCYAFADKVKDVGNISMALQPLIVDFGSQLFEYTDEQKHVFENQFALIQKYIKFTKSFDYYRGAMKMVELDGTTSTRAAHRFIADKTNNWSGWKCFAGVEQIIIDMGGNIYRGWCKVGNSIGHISDRGFNCSAIQPIICNKTMCHCNFDIMSTKEKL